MLSFNVCDGLRSVTTIVPVPVYMLMYENISSRSRNLKLKQTMIKHVRWKIRKFLHFSRKEKSKSHEWPHKYCLKH